MDVDHLLSDHSALTLKNLAAQKAAEYLWIVHYLQYGADRRDSFERSLTRLELPTLFNRTIARISLNVCKHSMAWLNSHNARIFHSDIDVVAIKCLPELVWRSDGSIDYMESAKALVNSTKLNCEEKYLIMCYYCMEDEMKKLWPRLVSDNWNHLRTSFEENALIWYWNGRMTDYSAILSDPNARPLYNDLLVDRMLSAKDVDNVAAVVYFLDRLPSERLVEVACTQIAAVCAEERAEYVKVIWSKFTNGQRYRAFNSYCIEIVRALLENRLYAKYAIDVWDQVKNIVAVSKFTIMFEGIFTMIGALHEKYRGSEDDYEDDDDDDTVFFRRGIFSVILSMWHSSPDVLKNAAMRLLRIIDVLPDQLLAIRQALRLPLRLVPRSFDQFVDHYIDLVGLKHLDIRFFATMLPYTVFRGRNFMRNLIGRRLVTRLQPRFVQQLMDICFSTERQALEFKETVRSRPETRSHLLNLMRRKKFDDLDEFIKVFVPIGTASRWKRIELLDNLDDPTSWVFGDDPDDISVGKMKKFIEDAFAATDDSSAKARFMEDVCETFMGNFKSAVMSRNEAYERLSTQSRSMEFASLVDIRMNFLNEREIDEFKRNLLEYFDNLRKWVFDDGLKFVDLDERKKFIDDAFDNDPEAGARFKEEICISCMDKCVLEQYRCFRMIKNFIKVVECLCDKAQSKVYIAKMMQMFGLHSKAFDDWLKPCLDAVKNTFGGVDEVNANTDGSTVGFEMAVISMSSEACPVQDGVSSPVKKRRRFSSDDAKPDTRSVDGSGIEQKIVV